MKTEQRNRIIKLLISGVEIPTIKRVENVSESDVNEILSQTARAASGYKGNPSPGRRREPDTVQKGAEWICSPELIYETEAVAYP